MNTLNDRNAFDTKTSNSKAVIRPNMGKLKLIVLEKKLFYADGISTKTQHLYVTITCQDFKM